MNTAELEEKYDTFLKSYHFPSDVKNRFLKKNAELDKLSRMADNLACNILFLKYYFEKARVGEDQYSMASNYAFIADGKEIVVNMNKSPDFKDKEAYLKWLSDVINN